MSVRSETITFECPREDIAAYIDGELDLADELRLEYHLDACRVCSGELVQQKQFLCRLDSSLRNEDQVELPPDFAKRIAVNAESTVVGLRRSREQFNAVFICAGLLLFVLFALRAEAGKIFEGVAGFFDQIVAVGSFFGHLIYSVLLGIAIILRSFAAQLQLDGALVAGLTFILALALMAVSRKVLRTHRA
ncbi:MAG: anti-sigma factor [Pyrinomonadaceae bacterium]